MFIDTVKTVEEDVLDMVTRVQEPIVTTVASLAETLADYVPERPAWPFLRTLPKLGDIVDTQVDFAHRVVTNQGEFARAMVKSLAPLLDRLEKVEKPSFVKRYTPNVPTKAAA